MTERRRRFFIHQADDGLIEIAQGDGTRYTEPAVLVGPGESFRGFAYSRLVRRSPAFIVVSADGSATIEPDTRSVRPERFIWGQTGHGLVFTSPDGTERRLVSPRVDSRGRRRIEPRT
jgi:hypothetical protein